MGQGGGPDFDGTLTAAPEKEGHVFLFILWQKTRPKAGDQDTMGSRNEILPRLKETLHFQRPESSEFH